MAFKDFMALEHLRFGIYSFTLFLVLIMGFVLTMTMDLDGTHSQARTMDQLARAQRQPASVLASEHLSESSIHWAPSVLEIDCADLSERPPFALQGAHVRVKTKGCEPKAIVNATNGFEATLFRIKDEAYSSDYISLAKGENAISIVRDVPGELPATISLLVLSQ